MKRNMDLIRAIAFQVEAASDNIDSTVISVDGCNEAEIAYHVELMFEADLLKGIDTTTMSSPYKEYHISRLTTLGHDFADATRSDTLWNKEKSTIQETTGGITIDLLILYLKQQAKSLLGISDE